MVVVLEGSSVIDMSPWLNQVPAVVMAFYPGQVGGAALGQLLWGQVNFSGKLPFTWGKQLSDYETFNGNGTTNFDYYVGYRYFDHNPNIVPQYLFGHGLSYTSFEYRKLQLGCSDMSKGAVLPVVVNVANTGIVAGDEIVMVFVSFPNTTARRPAKELKGFARVQPRRRRGEANHDSGPPQGPRLLRSGHQSVGGGRRQGQHHGGWQLRGPLPADGNSDGPGLQDGL
jgi:beta-glucosidase